MNTRTDRRGSKQAARRRISFLRRVRNARCISPVAKALALVLATRHIKDGSVMARQDALARELGRSARTVRRAARELECAGLVVRNYPKKSRRDGRWVSEHPNTYTLVAGDSPVSVPVTGRTQVSPRPSSKKDYARGAATPAPPSWADRAVEQQQLRDGPPADDHSQGIRAVREALRAAQTRHRA